MESEILQIIVIENKSKFKITEVVEIIEFTDERITLFTRLGNVSIKGKNLEIISAFEKTDSQVIISGDIYSLTFGNNNEKLFDNFISKLFK